MKTRLLLCALLFSAALAAPDRGSAQAPPTKNAVAFDAAGTYDIHFQTSEGGTPSVMVLTKKEGKLVGTLEIHGQQLEIGNVVAKGKVVSVVATGPHGELKFELTFKTNDEFEGTFSSGMGEGTVKGERRKS